MFRLLVIEDHTLFYEDYLLRIFKKTLPMDEIDIVRAADLSQALEVLPEAWDMILVDYSLGLQVEYQGETVRDGADLIGIRRSLEVSEKLASALIVGMSSNGAGNRLLFSRGANRTMAKLEVAGMAEMIKGALKPSE